MPASTYYVCSNVTEEQAEGMKEQILDYEKAMIKVFYHKYRITESDAKRLICIYGFNDLLEKCNYVALHDDPETWVDEVYAWSHEEKFFEM